MMHFSFFVILCTLYTNVGPANVTHKFSISSKIVNPHDFNYILNPEFQICGNTEAHEPTVFLLIYVHTTPKNLKRRLSIRETWARRSMFRDIRIVFMMGKTDEVKTKKLDK